MVGRTPQLSWLVLILLGSTIGTAVRSGLSGAFTPGPGEWPWVTFSINVVGSLLLGALLEGLARTGPDTGWRRGLRLGAGTGVLGGFTTYSTFSLETVLLLRGGHWVVALGYALASVVAGVVAALVGVRLVRAAARGLRAAGGGHR